MLFIMPPPTHIPEKKNIHSLRNEVFFKLTKYNTPIHTPSLNA